MALKVESCSSELPELSLSLVAASSTLLAEAGEVVIITPQLGTVETVVKLGMEIIPGVIVVVVWVATMLVEVDILVNLVVEVEVVLEATTVVTVEVLVELHLDHTVVPVVGVVEPMAVIVITPASVVVEVVVVV